MPVFAIIKLVMTTLSLMLALFLLAQLMIAIILAFTLISIVAAVFEA